MTFWEMDVTSLYQLSDINTVIINIWQKLQWKEVLIVETDKQNDSKNAKKMTQTQVRIEKDSLFQTLKISKFVDE